MIKITDLHKKFNEGTFDEVYALRGIDLDINQGDFITIIGTNGSGKSTLLNAISGSFIADKGKIEIKNKDVTKKHDYSRAKYIARVFQNPFLGTAPGMTIAENLHLANMRGKSRNLWISLDSKSKSYYREQIAMLEMQLEDRMNNVIGTLSGGQRQAITLLMAIIQKPDVLLLDEHTAALDPKSAAQLIRLTKMFIERDSLTTVMITHSMQQAIELGNRTIMMHKGKIIEEITLKEKSMLNVDDLLDKFANIRKIEKLTTEMLNEFRNNY